MTWIYDCETYRNFFSVTFKNVKTHEEKVFVIFEDRNDIDKLHEFISSKDKWFIGYNSISFDNQLLNYIHKKHPLLTFEHSNDICEAIYELATLIIRENYREYKYKLPFRSIDLMRVGGFYKSLKLIGVNLKWHKLQDLPIPWDSTIEKDQVELLLKYNLNDVLITEQLFNKLYDRIKLRYTISSKYNVDVISESDSGMANRLLEKFYSEASGLNKRDFKDLRTERNFIRFDWVVFKSIKFHSNTLNKLLEEVKNYVYYKDRPFYKKNIYFDNVEYKMGIGGLHSVDKGDIFEQTSSVNIVDADVASFYPSIMINYNLSPEHLGNTFMKKYKEIRNDRVKAKLEGDKVNSDTFKLILNSTFGC